ncbi:MAG: DUF4292 domain-containing protein [Chlorobi bacterium]|nr:DUF4292 domain-containing protein [Chlorobiota bacterium]MCI0715099.1 DUF4292 domain-containing protein [Chlorobiota bacterium]
MNIILPDVILPFICIFIISCTASQNTGEPDKIPVRDLKAIINQNSSLIETLEASGNISFDSPEQSGSGWIELKIKKPDTVFVKIEGPFGISVANALITRNSFIYYNVQENKVITGPSSDINIGAILRIKVTFDELINGFTAGFKFDEGKDDSLIAGSENNFYVLNVNGLNGNQKYLIEPGKYTIKKYNYMDNDNTMAVEVDYTSYLEEELSGKSVYLPASIKIKNPSKKQTVYVDYINTEINKKGLSFKIKIPKSAKVIKWQ